MVTKHDKQDFQELLMLGIQAKYGRKPQKVQIKHRGGDITGINLVWPEPEPTGHDEFREIIHDLNNFFNL